MVEPRAMEVMLADPVLLISGVSAAIQAVRTWIAFRDSRRAALEFNETQQRVLGDPATVAEGAAVAGIVPDPVLQTIVDRAERCWTRYHDVLNGRPRAYSDPEIDEATQGVKDCICTELNRIVVLGGMIPPGRLAEAYSAYCPRKP